MLANRARILLVSGLALLLFLCLSWLDDLWDHFGAAGVLAANLLLLLCALVVLAIAWWHTGRRARGKELLFQFIVMLFGTMSLVFIGGFMLPVEHVASKTVRLDQAPERVWQALEALPPAPTWRPWVAGVRRLSKPVGSRTPARESDAYPHWVFFNRRELHDHHPETLEYSTPRRVVLKDYSFSSGEVSFPKSDTFTGTWTVEVMPASGGSILTITERAEIYSPLFRFFARCLGYTWNMSNYVNSLDELMMKSRDPRVLTSAIGEQNIAVVEGLLALGADANAQDGSGRIPLVYAASNGQTDIVQVLLAKGVDVDIKDDYHGNTALMQAVWGRHAATAETLLASGAAINAKDRRGRTALMDAAAQGSTDLVQILLAKGADVNLKDGGGRNAQEFAARYGHTDLLELLKKAGAAK